MVLFGLALGACRTNATVNVRADQRGRGAVSIDLALDRTAALGLGKGGSRLLTSDLAAAGWAIGGLEAADNGGATVHAEKAFANVAQANAVLRELTGPTGALSSLRLERRQTLTGLRVAINGKVDLTSGLGAFGDANLKSLTGSLSNLGIDDSEVARQAGSKLTDAFRFTLSADLIDASKRWDVNVGTEQAVSLAGRRFAYEVLAGFAAIAVAVVGLALLFLSLRKRAGDL
jgi:hypothetical protein